ncbi:uncharacterized protein GO595_001555 [Histomonas meleagridis]|uniref:uncharacterized protein n=1 Tax=Histomonas meleagridis TaxID=135588 RepID=UPI00355A046E|nr:hypothetical protein GO595_001555 [Histomonas meleagridis]
MNPKKCAPFLSGALQALQEIQTYIPHLASPSATSMVQYQDALSQKVGFVLQFFDKIVEAVANCENQYSYRLERIQQSEHQISHQIAAAIATLDQLYIELVFLSSNKNIVASPTHSQQLTQWIQVVSGMSQTLFQTPRKATEGILKALPQIITQFPSLAALIGTIQPLITESDDFAQASNALTTSMQAINEITTKILYKSITQIIKDLVQDYLNEKPLDSLIQLGQDLLAQTRDMIAPLGNNVIGAYSTFATLISICKTDPELTAITLISISRYASFILPDFHKSEELLINITKKIVLITKSIFKEVGKIVSQIISVIDTNLEFFNDTTLNETNFYLSAIKNVEDFEPESNDFILIQQRFFDALAALPIPLNKLVTSCPDVDTKGQLNGLYTQITILSNRFTRWLNQFYLTIFSVIQLRSQSILDVLSFPISILSTLGNQTSLQNILVIVSGIQTIMQTTPEITLGNYGDINSLIKHIIDLTKIGNEYNKVVSTTSNLAFSILFKQSSEIFTKLLNNIPNLALSLQLLRNYSNTSYFICGMIGSLSRSLELFKEYQTIINRVDATSCYFLSIPLTFILICDALIKTQPNAGATLSPTMKTLRTSIDIIWPIAISVACGQNPAEAAHFPTYAASILKSIDELLKIVLALPQPSLQYDVPDDVQEIKRFDSMASSLHSTALKQFAQFIVLKVLEISDSSTKINNAITQLLTGSTNDRSSFIENFATFSVSIASYENSFGKTVAPIVSQLHKQFIEVSRDLLESGRNSQPQLMKIYGYVAQILALSPISKLKQKEMNDYLAKILKKILISLSILRNKGNSIQLTDTLSTIYGLKELQAFYQISPQNDLNVNELLDLVITNRTTKELIDKYISIFSEKLLELIPNQFLALDRIRDGDTVCDFVYDKADIFREDVNQILQLAKTHNTNDDLLSEPLKSMLLSASDAAVLTMHSLMLAGLAFTPLSATFVDCYSELSIALKEFTDLSFQISQKKTTDLSSELRRINRKMSKQFDAFINIVENPQQQSTEYSEFESTKNQMYTNLSTVIVQIARLNALVSTSLVPEMYTSSHEEIIENIQDSINQLNNSVSVVRSKAVGQSSTEIGSLMSQLETQVNTLIDISKKIDFNISFSPKPLYSPINDVCQITHKMAILGPSLTDRIVIEPDPVSASKIPSDYKIPALPKSAPSPSEALQDLTLAKRQVDEMMVNFKAIIDTTLATSGELLQQIEELNNVSNTFAEKALVMAVATVDSRYQVEQQTALHAFANAINSIQSAMKNRLLRVPTFAHDMEEAIQLYNTSIEKCMELAETASKIEIVVEEDESMNEVTRELNATANAIEAMSAKLKEFENQVNMEEIESEEIDATQNIQNLKAAEGTLPAFLISCATPIFAASSAIVKRAQEITAQLLANFGKNR